jgi:transcriptional regulator with XRE-family HTH domain
MMRDVIDTRAGRRSQLSPEAKATADRMVRLREAFAPSQTEFCQRYGFSVPQWSNYENGQPIGRKAAISLVHQIDGLSLDWLYLGTIEGLTVAMARRLGEL